VGEWEDWKCFTIDQQDTVTDLWDKNYIELSFWVQHKNKRKPLK
jgi:hypothetical protein